MKQRIINDIWTPSVKYLTVYEFWINNFEEGDLIKTTWLNKKKQKVNIIKNGVNINSEAKMWSGATFTTNDNDISFGTYREKMELGIYMGILEPVGVFEPVTKVDLVNYEYEFKVHMASKTDWIFNYLEDETGLDPFKHLHSTITSLVVRSLWMYKIKEFSELLPHGINPSLALILLKKRHKFAEVDTIIKNIKSYPQMMKTPSENIMLIEEILAKYSFKFNPNIFNKEDVQRLKYSSIFALLKLNQKDILEAIDHKSFQNDPWSARKILKGYDEQYLDMKIKKVDDKYSLNLNGIPYHDGTRSLGTIFWNIWGLILNGNIRLTTDMVEQQSEYEFVENFVDRHIILDRYSSMSQTKQNYHLMGDNKGSKIYRITSSYFINGYRNIEPNTRTINDNTNSAIKFVDDFNKYEYIVKRMPSYKASKISIQEGSIIKLRRIFSSDVDKYYKTIKGKIRDYTSVSGVRIEATDKAHIFEVSEAKKIDDYASIKDPDNCLLLSPNIHRLWDKGFLRIRPDGKIVTNQNEDTKYSLDQIELTDNKIKYLEMRYVMDIEKDSHRELISARHFIA